MSLGFRLMVGARDRLYERGLLQSYPLQYPVISVGNLTTGGTGKTPLVILLAQRFQTEGFRPVVLSRGYKRRSSGVVVVSIGDGPLVPWDVAGDEPSLIAKRTRGVAVVVGADRYVAGQVAEEQNLGDLFILDDGFQHRRLFRNVDLVTIDPDEWAAGERLLPLGRWREPKEALGRADAAIIQRGAMALSDLPVPAFRIETVVDGIFEGDSPVSPKSLKNRSVTAFAGIAKPVRFFSALESIGISLKHRVQFPDHHSYSIRDIEDLPGEIHITTEKDAVRLERMGGDDGPAFLHLRISANIPELEQLMELIRSRLR